MDINPGSEQRNQRTRWLRIVEIGALLAGTALLGYYTVVRVQGSLASSAAIEEFERSIASKAAEPEPASGLPSQLPVDTTLWSEGRIEEYERDAGADLGLPLAILRIPSVGIEVPIFEGTDEAALNRGAGRIEGTAFPGSDGNVGLASHRDGFFRPLEDISLGDAVVIQDLEETTEYIVDDLRIVKPTDVWVLDATENPTVTLVTCYPFYFVGSAPQRFIVRAVLSEYVEERRAVDGVDLVREKN